ncbi:MAG TPA: IS5 family transposase [Chlamydiales bacterium]|nr:IS5 family transposase [Chlamydiales bacterium]
MKPRPIRQDQDLLFQFRLSEQLNPKHELLQLANAIEWHLLEAEFLPLFTAGAGHPPLPIRLACGLMILQHMFNLSDERVVEVWIENPYWQAFCGYDFLQWELPAHPTSLTHWRKRIEARGVEKILQLSVSVALRTNTVTPAELSKTISDTTVMPKAVAHPVDAKLIRRSIERIVRAAKVAGIHLKRTFDRVATWALKDYLRLMHGKKIRKAQKPLKKLRRYLSKLLKELDPHLENCPQPMLRDMVIGAKLLLQNGEDKNKIYSCHEPQVSCIAKGKAHKPYEFGSKASILLTEQKGIVLSMITHLRNPYDGHLLAESKQKAEMNAQTAIKRILVDRGFRGHDVTDAEVLVSYTKGLPKPLKRALRRRQAIEPWIGHMKHDGKFGRCHLKGILGDQIHATLVAVAHNFQTILRKLRIFCIEILGRFRNLILMESEEISLLEQAI